LLGLNPIGNAVDKSFLALTLKSLVSHGLGNRPRVYAVLQFNLSPDLLSRGLRRLYGLRCLWLPEIR
jgi:hypothetical protein